MPRSDNLWYSRRYRGYDYFEGAEFPEGTVPFSDSDAWPLFPEHNWIYDKLEVARSQGLRCGPHGVPPPAYPVFSKPVTNIFGMGAGSRLLRSADEYERHCQPGHMWMEHLTGDHISTDAAVVEGRAVWRRSAIGRPMAGGTFDHWEILPDGVTGVSRYVTSWIGEWLPGFTGIINLETIGGRIIEAHLRLSDQWVDIYGGADWGRAVLALYQGKDWSFAERDTRTGYSIALFAPHGQSYRHPPANLVSSILTDAAISTVQITFWEDYPSEQQPSPPGGFRLAVINAWDLAAGIAARRRLAGWFEAHGMGPCLVER
jgi:hypothetical protein